MKKFSRRIALIVMPLMLVLTAAAVENTSKLDFLVLKDSNGKPVRNASVVLHPVNSHGKQERGGLQLKTDADGKTSFDGAPYGRLGFQLLPRGFQTLGWNSKLNQRIMMIRIK